MTDLLTAAGIGLLVGLAFLGTVFLVEGVRTLRAPAPEHHRCRVCHDQGAFLVRGATKPSICPWCPRDHDDEAA